MRYQHLRHGAASLLAAQGVPQSFTMRVLGHSQISTTMNVYTHIVDESLREGMDSVGEAYLGRFLSPVKVPA